MFQDFSYITFSIVSASLFINLLLATAIIFLERREPTSTWAWILVLFFLPVIGFILYLLFGRKLRKKHLFRWEGRKKIGIDNLVNYQIDAIKEHSLEYRKNDVAQYRDIVYMHLLNNHAVLTQDNKVDIFDDGHEKFDALIHDILSE